MTLEKNIFWIKKEEAKIAITRFSDILHGMNGQRPFSYYKLKIGSHWTLNQTTFQWTQAKEESQVKDVLEWLTSSLALNWELQIKLSDNPLNNYAFSLSRELVNDKITISWNSDSNPQPDTFITLIKNLSSSYSFIPSNEIIEERFSEDINLQKNLVAQLVQSASESAVRLHNEINGAIQTLAKTTIESNSKLKIQIDEERLIIQAERRNSLAELEKERELFNQEKKSFNDKKSTLVRRDLLQQISKKLDEQGRKFELSTNTKEMQQPIRWVCLALTILSVILTIVFGFKVFNDQSFELQHSIPLTASTLLLLSTAIYYLRWQNLWLRRHAELEIKSQLMHYDMLRASWFAELMFEYKDEQGKLAQLPESVIQVMTKNLFIEPGATDPPLHFSDDLVQFTKKITELKLSGNGLEMKSEGK